MPNVHYVTESPVDVGQHEAFAYAVDCSALISPGETLAFSALRFTVKGSTTDVSATYLTGSPTVDSPKVTLPLLHGLTYGTTYELQLDVSLGGGKIKTVGIVFRCNF